jgi:branched-chain amino acid transport system substrate-binding protein
MIVSLFAGCSQKPAEGTAEPIKIGTVGPLSGGAAMVGDTQVKGIQLAIDQFNEAGGIHGRELVLIQEDDEQNPAKSVSAMNKLVHNDNVIAVIGTVNSSATLANMEVTKEAEVPQITAISSNPKITLAGNPWIFRLQASDTHQCEAIVNYALDELGLERIAIMYQSDDYGTGGKDVAVELLQARGIEPVAVEAYDPNAKDMTAQLLKVKEGNPQALIMWTMYQQGALIARQARQMGLSDVVLMGGGGLTNAKLYELAGDAVVGLLNSQTFFPDKENASPVAKEFIEAYEEKFGMLPDSNAAMSYDSMLILGEAMKAAGPDLDNVAIRDAIAATTNFPGATGVINIDENGDANRDMLIIGVTGDGGYEVVWQPE